MLKVSKIAGLLLVLVLVGSGCVPSSDTAPASTDQTATSTTPPPKVTTDVTQWIVDTSLSGVTFAYPPELTYLAGGDIDTGSWSWLQDEDSSYFGFFAYALIKCRFSDPDDCNLGTNISATPTEVYETVLRENELNPELISAGNVSVGNTIGRKFIPKTKNPDGFTKAFIVFQSKDGVYKLEDQQDSGDVFNSLLETIVVTQ